MQIDACARLAFGEVVRVRVRVLTLWRGGGIGGLL
jgi:hypothetical protein